MVQKGGIKLINPKSILLEKQDKGKRKKEYLYFYEGTNVFQFHLKQSLWGQNGKEGILKVFDNFNVHNTDLLC